MIEKVCKEIEVFMLKDIADIKAAADAVINGKITLLRIGSVYSFIINPKIAGLLDKFNLLKERRKEQLMSLVCSYEQALKIVDRDRVNKDFFSLPANLCSKVIFRIPVDTALDLSFPYDSQKGTVQFFSFDDSHPVRRAFKNELSAGGLEYLLITSGNIHGAPTIDDFDSAKTLAVMFNIKASFLGMEETQTVVTDIPEDRNSHRGSYIILSFCNPEFIEVKRLANKTDKEVTDKHLKTLFKDIYLQTPIIYSI